MKMIGPVDWAIILWSSVGWGLLAGVVGPKPMVPTVAEEDKRGSEKVEERRRRERKKKQMGGEEEEAIVFKTIMPQSVIPCHSRLS